MYIYIFILIPLPNLLQCQVSILIWGHVLAAGVQGTGLCTAKTLCFTRGMNLVLRTKTYNIIGITFNIYICIYVYIYIGKTSCIYIYYIKL